MRVLGLGEHLNTSVGGGVAEQTPESLADFEKSVSAAAANRLSVHQHSVETETIANILDVIERVDARHPVRDLRFALIHGEGVTRELLGRMKALGMGFGADTRWMIFRKGVNALFIPDAPPLRTALDMGIPVTFGSDGMIAGPINPFMWLYSVVTGRNWLGEVVRPNERLTREEALDAITRGASWFSFDEDLKGVIAPGRLGDFVILDRDYFTVSEEEIGRIRPLATVVGGRVVYEAAEVGPAM
jgi:predicted amidohydrolase YtcJ